MRPILIPGVCRAAILSLVAFAIAQSLTNAAEMPPITAAVFDPKEERVVLASQAGIEVRSWPELKFQRKLETKLPHVHDLQFSPRGDLLAAAGGAPAERGTVEFFHWPSGEPAGGQSPHRDVIYGFAWRDDGLAWATASGDGTVRVFDQASGKQLRECTGHSGGVLAVCYLPDRRTLVSAGLDHSLRVWDADEGTQIRALTNHTAPVVGLALRPQANATTRPLVASISRDRSVRFWQPTIGRLVRFARLPSDPLALSWTADGLQVVVSCEDGRVRVLDPDTVQIVAEYPALDGWAHTLALPTHGRDFFVGGAGGKMLRGQLQRGEGKP